MRTAHPVNSIDVLFAFFRWFIERVTLNLFLDSTQHKSLRTRIFPVVDSMQKTKSLYEKQTNWPSLPVWTARVMWNTTRPRTVAMIFTFMMSSFSQSSLNSCCQWKGNEGSLYLSCSLHTISERLCATPCCVADSFNCTPAFVVCVLLTHLFFLFVGSLDLANIARKWLWHHAITLLAKNLETGVIIR